MSVSAKEALPRTVGLCSDPTCAVHFYMPDAKPGDKCPMEHDRELVIYEVSGVAPGEPDG